ncbi:serine hydrolase [Rubrivirga sp.]|uniref:serine hydrolase n=1 Tax=Rubrivirga sp. TaxID=1885344 RepID=UPI003B529BB3
MSVLGRVRSAAASAARQVRRRRRDRASTLGELAAVAGGTLAVEARHLGTGRSVSAHPDRPCKLASIVKVPLAALVLDRIDEGRLGLGDVVAVEPRHLCPGSGVIAGRMRVPGLSLSVENLLRLALAESDNTATDVLFDLVGGPTAVQAFLDAHGHPNVRVDRTIRGLVSALHDVPIQPGDDPDVVLRGAPAPSAAYARSFFADPRDTATPRALVDLFADLWAGRLLPPEPTAWLVAALGEGAVGGRRFRALLPAGAVVAHKTGTLWGGAGRMVADAGVVRLLGDAGHVAVAAFLTGSDRPKREQEAVLAHAARIAVDALR